LDCLESGNDSGLNLRRQYFLCIVAGCGVNASDRYAVGARHAVVRLCACPGSSDTIQRAACSGDAHQDFVCSNRDFNREAATSQEEDTSGEL
jgi:hypothetical protein